MHFKNEVYGANEKLLLFFDNSWTVAGTQKIHAINPLSELEMLTRPYCMSSQEYMESLLLSKDMLKLKELQSGFVAFNYEGSLWFYGWKPINNFL